ncbi:hypothetical protein OHS70_38560 (plasmid) [Streptomyces sp. NBC_00390]|uniref:hypothetical protein n=1 Tax=Streptomyces sp. NBC_00390 TaxID=2975736 RepID=UPI002E245ADB
MTTVVDEVTALTWYAFIRDRMEEGRQAAIRHQDEAAMTEYRTQRRAVMREHRDLLDALARGDNAAAEDRLWALRNRASKWQAHPEYPVPISDGTMPCPVAAPETGHPCTKRIPSGWAAYKGHAGGHFWQDPKVAELEAGGAHYDPAVLLSGQPTKWHLPGDCTPGCWKWRD